MNITYKVNDIKNSKSFSIIKSQFRGIFSSYSIILYKNPTYKLFFSIKN